VGKLRTVLPLSDVIRDSAVQLGLNHSGVVFDNPAMLMNHVLNPSQPLSLSPRLLRQLPVWGDLLCGDLRWR
jgi:hypothetical protein